MNDQTVAQPGAVALEPPSTVLNPETVSTVSGGGKVDLSPGDDGSIQSVLEAEMKTIKESTENPEDEAKAKAEEAAKVAKDKVSEAEKKPQVKDDKPEKAEIRNAGKTADDQSVVDKPAAERSGEADRQSEGRKYAEPPARFLPEARGKWANVPNEVKAEFHRVSEEFERETTRLRASHDRYEPIRQFDEAARSNGRELRQSLERVVQIEDALSKNPIAGLEMILREVGPVKSDGSRVSLYDVAHYVAQQSREQFSASIQSAFQPQSPARQQADPAMQRIQDLERHIVTMEAEKTLLPMITSFRDQNPDYETLEPQIAEILRSGVVEKIYGTGLSPEQRLAEAYRMAGGSPSRSDGQADTSHSGAERARPVNLDAGQKSIRGGPSDGADTAVDEPETDIREMLRKEMRKLAS